MSTSTSFCPLLDKTVDKMDKTLGQTNALFSVDLSRGTKSTETRFGDRNVGDVPV